MTIGELIDSILQLHAAWLSIGPPLVWTTWQMLTYPAEQEAQRQAVRAIKGVHPES